MQRGQRHKSLDGENRPQLVLYLRVPQLKIKRGTADKMAFGKFKERLTQSYLLFFVYLRIFNLGRNLPHALFLLLYKCSKS